MRCSRSAIPTSPSACRWRSRRCRRSRRSTRRRRQTDLDKVIILLTDGDNTENRWSTNQNTIDARTKLACNNVKAANIKLYTIRVINGNASLLQQCATKADMYYDVQNASQLSAVFSTIAQNLANLRLAK